MRLPIVVEEARGRALAHGFGYSCESPAGELLAALAAAVPEGGRVLELGTGAGVGLAWIVHGLTGRDDVSVVSVEHDPETARIAAAGDWPEWARIVVGDAVALLPDLGEGRSLQKLVTPKLAGPKLPTPKPAEAEAGSAEDPRVRSAKQRPAGCFPAGPVCHGTLPSRTASPGTGDDR